jgi:hypothetical protein
VRNSGRSGGGLLSRRAAGVGLLAIGSFLYSMHFIVAAIYGSGTAGRGRHLFLALRQYVGTNLVVLSIISGILGLGYLIWAEVEREG